MEGTSRSCTYREIYLGPEGVAAATLLDDNIDPWFQMTTPHLTLAVARHHEAKNLGPMIARARAVQEWTPMDNPAIHVNPSREFIRISFPDTTAKCVAEHVERERTPEPPTPPEREPEDPEVKAMLDSLPSSLWATGPYDMGYTPQHKIRIPLKPGATTIYRVQYKVKKEAETGITKTIEGLKEAGVLRPSNSPWNTPILPVKKADGLTWRMAHDLRAINDVTEGPPETVPNPQVALHGVTPDHQWFTCIDLANAFFCLPLDEASQPLFAFTWKGEHLTYTRMPQGYRSTPTIFNDCVRRDLKDLPLPDNVTIIQYVDDLLIAATTKEDCMEGTKRLLERVAQAGYKVKRAKLQPVQQRVVFLGRTLGPDQREMTQAAKETILAYPRPETVQQLLGFLGLANYSRQYLPEFTEKTAELRQLINTAGTKNLQARLQWTTTADTVHDEIYQEAWEQDMEGTSRSCTYREIYLGPEGVAAATLLDDNIDPWFQMTTPHLTLAVARHHEAKNLGPMIARARAVQEWTPMDNPAIHVNPSREFIRISFPDTTAKCVAEHVERERTPEPPTPPEREPEDPEVKAMLDSLPSSLWATGPYDMGYTPQHKIRIPLKPGATTIYRVQYKVKKEAETGITKTIEGLKEAGVLRPSNSPWNTPILPVKKADGLTWRMAHDLRAINDVTEGPPETVPNPQVALHGVTPDHQWFTCIDLANAFFCLPLDEASQPLFAFTWKGEHLTYTRMPQGYRSTPTIFNDCVRRDLKDLPLPDNVTIIQYVDDLLIAATTKEDCMEGTKRLLERVAQAGYKVKRAKLQPVQQRVVFLGRTLGGWESRTGSCSEPVPSQPIPWNH